MEVKIRKGQKADLASVLALIKELAEFEKAIKVSFFGLNFFIM